MFAFEIHHINDKWNTGFTLIQKLLEISSNLSSFLLNRKVVYRGNMEIHCQLSKPQSHEHDSAI